MSDEQREILKMVADKTITVEEAERLLRALEDGARAREHQPKDRRGVGGAFDALGDVLSDIGPIVKNAVEDAVSGIGFGQDEPDDADLERIEWEGVPLAVAPGTVVDIVQRRTGVRHGAGLTLEGIPGESCTIEGPDAADVRVYRHEGRIHIRWAHGDLTIRVPETAAKVAARVFGGSIRSKGLDCPTQLKTMGGSLDVVDARHPFDVKTMGGGISIALAPGFHGEGHGHTMGGSVTATVPRDLTCSVHAVTMGGTVEVDGGMAQVERSKAAGKQTVNVTIGAGPASASLRLKTMGGSIAVRRSDD